MPVRVVKRGEEYRLADAGGKMTPARFDSRERAEKARAAINAAMARKRQEKK